MSEILKKAINPKLNRRSFLKWSAGVSGALAASGALQNVQQATAASGDGETLVPSGCGRSHCGNNCVIKAAVKNYGTPGAAIVRIETDDQPDVKGTYQLRACARGRSIKKHVYSENRIKYPMKRKNWSPGGGNRSLRGNDEWVRISWDEATTIIASEMTRIKAAYGNEGFHDFGQSGINRVLHGRSWVQRLLNKFGGYTTSTGSYSFPGCSTAHRYLWGGGMGSMHDQWDMLKSDYVLLWSYNPVSNGRQALTDWYLVMVKEAGIRRVLVDPWYHRTGQTFADEWVPIKFQTDEAMMLAMLYVLFKEYGAHIDQPWIDARSVGIFPRKGAGTPEDPTVPADDCLKYYVLGLGADGKPAPAGHKNYPAKTPAWASTDTGVPAKTIIRITKEYADNSVFKGTGKKAAFYTGWGMNRRAYGENPFLLAAAIATITKNIGVSGGGPGFTQGMESLALGSTGAGAGANPIAATHQFDVGNRGLALAGEKVRKENDFTWQTYKIKMLWTAGGNIINQGNDSNYTLKAIRDNIEFHVVSDPIWSVSAKFADLVLPITSTQEHDDMQTGYHGSPYLLFINKCINPIFEAKTDMDACKMVADKLGITGFLPAGNEDTWLAAAYAGAKWSTLTYAQFKAAGVAKYDRWDKPNVFLKEFIANPATGMPKPTVPSGKMEFYSMKIKQLIDTGKLNDKNGAPPKDTRPIPTYPPRIEGPGDPIMKKYPLACGQPASFKGSHSTFRDLPWIKEIGPEEDGVIMNTDDAAARGIKTGDKVRVWNDRGEMWLKAYVTNTVIRGGVITARGSWYDPVNPGVIGSPVRGGASVLTMAGRTSSLNVGTPSGSCAVQIAKLPDNFIVNPLRKEG